jgi:hypothetical protein
MKKNECKRLNDILYTLSPANASNIVVLANNDINNFINQYPLIPANSWVNCYITDLTAKAYVYSLPQQNLPDVDAATTQYEKTMLAQALQWNSPRIELNIWTTKLSNPTSENDWNLEGIVSVLNTNGFKYTIYSLMRYLSENLSRGFGQGAKLGISLKDVGYGVLKDLDRIVISGTFVQELISLEQDTLPVVVQGTVNQVAEIRDTTTASATGTKSQRLAARVGRKALTVRHAGTSNILYAGIGDVTTASQAITAGATYTFPTGTEGSLWLVTSTGIISSVVTETYNS